MQPVFSRIANRLEVRFFGYNVRTVSGTTKTTRLVFFDGTTYWLTIRHPCLVAGYQG